MIRRIRHVLRLAASEDDRGTIERVVSIYADGCPVARSLKGSMGITSELDLATST